MISLRKIISGPLNLLVLIFLISVSAEAQNFNSEVEASIKTNDNKDNLLEITGISKNLTEATYSLHYELSVITSDGFRISTSIYKPINLFEMLNLIISSKVTHIL